MIQKLIPLNIPWALRVRSETESLEEFVKSHHRSHLTVSLDLASVCTLPQSEQSICEWIAENIKKANNANRETCLPRRLDSLDHGEANNRPGNQQAHSHLPVESSTLGDAVGDVQGLAVPVVGGGRALLTLWHHIFGKKMEDVMPQPWKTLQEIRLWPVTMTRSVNSGLKKSDVSYMYWSCSWRADTHATAEVAGRTGRNRRGSSWWWHCSREPRRSTPTGERRESVSKSSLGQRKSSCRAPNMTLILHIFSKFFLQTWDLMCLWKVSQKPLTTTEMSLLCLASFGHAWMTIVQSLVPLLLLTGTQTASLPVFHQR